MCGRSSLTDENVVFWIGTKIRSDNLEPNFWGFERLRVSATMQIEKVVPEERVEGFVRKFDVPDWRDTELNLYLTLTRATDSAPPEKPRPTYVDPYDDPFPLYRKVPKLPGPEPPVVKVPHQAPKSVLYNDPKPMQSMVRDVLRGYRDHPFYTKTTHARDYQEAMACFHLRCAVVQWPKRWVPDPPLFPESNENCNTPLTHTSNVGRAGTFDVLKL